MQQLFDIHDIRAERFHEYYPEHVNSILEANRSTGFKENRGKLTEFFANGVMLCTIQGLRNLKASKSLSPRYLRTFDILQVQNPLFSRYL